MAKRKSVAANIVLNAYDDLFETDESREDKRRERIYEIPLEQIRDMPDHPYKVKDDNNMAELVESVKEHGLLQPVLARPLEEEDTYEMVSGHRRKRAYELAGLETIPCRVRELTKDEAIIMMVDSNLQREEILPSEKAFAYKMKLEALKRQGQRTDLTSNPLGGKLGETASFIGEQIGDSGTQVRRYIRLTNLIPDLLNLVDEGRIKLRPAVELSYLPEETQTVLFDEIQAQDATPSHAQAIRLRKLYETGSLSENDIAEIMAEEKGNQKEKPMFRDKRIAEAIPKNIPPEKHCDYVLKALDHYNRYRQRNRDAR
ncbi:MAG: ParB/RepB/Spo0J family partition protein [Clostridia bacterium]|nr:ParB/RepB/Spo0J family partition protein [Clostridia bacterium]